MRLTNFNLEMFVHAEDVASLSAKAAETHHLLFAVCGVCSSLNTGSDRDNHRRLALESLAGAYKVFKEGDMFLTHAAANKKAAELLDAHLLHYNWLLHNALSNGYRCYPIQFNTHNIWHIADHAKCMNPRFTWCYEFEDFMGSMVTSAKACLAGAIMSLIGSKVVQHFCLVLEMQLRFKSRLS